MDNKSIRAVVTVLAVAEKEARALAEKPELDDVTYTVRKSYNTGRADAYAEVARILTTVSALAGEGPKS